MRVTTASPAIAPPKPSEPVSPMNTDAGNEEPQEAHAGADQAGGQQRQVLLDARDERHSRVGREHDRRASAYGLLVGIGVPLLVVAYLNREGPGTVCHSFDGGRGVRCDDLYDPRKWAVVGLLFISAGVAGQLFAARPRVPNA